METKENTLAKQALKYGILFLIFHAFMSFFRANMTLMMPCLMTFITEDMGISLAQAGMFYQVPSTVMGIGMLAGSIIIDKFGAYKTLIVAMITQVIASIVGWLAPGYSMTIVSRVIFGFSMALSYPAVMAIVAERFHNQKQRGIASAVIQSTNCATNVATQRISVPVFMALSQNYHSQQMIWGVGALLCCIVFAVSDPKQISFFNEYNQQFAEEAKAIAAEEKEAPGTSLLKAIKMRKVWAAVIAFTGATWLYTMYCNYLPTILKTVHGLTPAEASNVTSLINTVGIIVCLLTGILIRKLKDFKFPMILCMIILTAGGVMAAIATPGPLMTLAMILIGIGWFCFIPIVNTAVMMSEGVTPKIFAAGTAIWTVLGCVLCLFLPKLFGALTAAYGMQKAVLWMCLGGIIAIGGACYYPGSKKATK